MIVQVTDDFADWLAGLKDRTGATRIAARIQRIEATGHFGDWKPISGAVAELRFTFGPGYRVYFVRRGDELIILLGGGDKDSQDRDIAKAIELATEIED